MACRIHFSISVLRPLRARTDGNAGLSKPAVKNPLESAIVGALVEIGDGATAVALIRPAAFDGHQRSPGVS
jgi:hypothetical protein